MSKFKNHIISEASKYVIMDMGKSYKVNFTMMGPDGKKTTEIPRYGVWIMSGNTAKEVVYTSNDLEMLQKKYDVPDDRIFKIK